MKNLSFLTKRNLFGSVCFITLSNNYLLLVTFFFISCGDNLDKPEESLANSHKDPAPLPDNIESLAVNVEELKDVGGVTFLKNSSIPYSGYAIELSRGRKNILLLNEGWVVRHVGYFANGLKERDSFYTPKSVSMRKYSFPNQISQFLDGCYTQWHRNGFKKYQSHYMNGKLHGLNTFWYANGSKKKNIYTPKEKETDLLQSGTRMAKRVSFIFSKVAGTTKTLRVGTRVGKKDHLANLKK